MQGQLLQLAIKFSHILDLDDRLRKIAGTTLSLLKKNEKGRIIVEFADNSQFGNMVGRSKTMTRCTSDSTDERSDIQPKRKFDATKKKEEKMR